MVDTSSVSQPPASLERTLVVTTPEHVAIAFPLAGLGSRFSALIADVGIMLLMWLVPIITLKLFDALTGLGDGWAMGLLVLWTFAIVWGYFFAYEAFRDGQTPGKRILNIRTVMDGGYPVTVRAAAIRSLVRLVDIQPGASCLVGGLSMMLNSQGKRLGDIAAGTVVVRELPIAFPDVKELSTANAAAPRFDDKTYLALETFADRVRELKVAAAAPLAKTLSAHIAPHMAREPGESTTEFVLRAYEDESARRQSARLRVAAGSAAAVSLLRSKRRVWDQFHRLVQTTRRKSLKSLDEDAVSAFAARYREITADLARARTYGASANTLYALERVAGAAHNVFYRPARRSAGQLGHFLRRGFPRLVRRLWKPILTATLLLYVPGIISYSLVTKHPGLEASVAGADMMSRADTAASNPDFDYIDTFDMPWMGSSNFASMLIANNVQVAFLAFAGGILAGLGSVYVLIFNGALLGAALAVFANRDVLSSIGLFVFPHGVIELTAITIAGGAGLWLGSALFMPGRLTRGRALAEHARDAIGLVLGVAFLLVIAGIIEGFISPSRIAVPLKLTAGAAAAGWLVLYLTAGGRRSDADTPATEPRAP